MRQNSHRINTDESGHSSSSATVALGLEEWHNSDDPDVEYVAQRSNRLSGVYSTFPTMSMLI